MSFFDGLHSYEILMLVAGCLLFLASLVLMVVSGSTGKPIGKLIPFFVVSIVMIGFPSYENIEISKNGVKLKKATEALLQNPTDPALRQETSNVVGKLADRPIQDPAVATTIARAQLALGDNDSAENRVNKILQAAPQNLEAVQLKARIELDRKLEQLTTQVERNPEDHAARIQLGGIVSETSRMPVASPKTLSNLARAQVVLGDKAQARDNVDKVLKIDPNSTPAIILKDKIKAMVVERPH